MELPTEYGEKINNYKADEYLSNHFIHKLQDYNEKQRAYVTMNRGKTGLNKSHKRIMSTNFLADDLLTEGYEV